MEEKISSDYVPHNIKKDLNFFKLSIVIGIIVLSIYTIRKFINILSIFIIEGYRILPSFIFYFIQSAIIITMILITLSSRKVANIIPERSQEKMKNFSFIYFCMVILQLLYLIFEILSLSQLLLGVIVFFIFLIFDILFLIGYGASLYILGQMFELEKEFFENKTRKLYSFYGIIAVYGIIMILIVFKLILPSYSINLRDFIIGVMGIIMFGEIYTIINKITSEMFDSNRVAKFNAENLVQNEQISKSDTSHPNDKLSNKDKKITTLLCLFFGELGVHRFYVEKPLSGLLYLCTGGVFYFGKVYDFIRILTGKFTDGDGKLITDSSTTAQVTQQPSIQHQLATSEPNIQNIKQEMDTEIEAVIEAKLEDKINLMTSGEVIDLNDIAKQYSCSTEQVKSILRKLLSKRRICGSLNLVKDIFTTKEIQIK